MSQPKNKPLVNTFTGGMNRDVHPSFVPESDVTYRLNSDKISDRFVGQADTNAKGTLEFVKLPKQIVGSVSIDERNWIIFLSKDNDKDAIGYVDLGTAEYTEIVNAQEFGCDWHFRDCYKINVEYDHVSGCNELKLYFSSDYEYYHVNIDEMLNEDRKAGLLRALLPVTEDEGACGLTDCSYFKIFKSTCGVRTSPVKTAKGGYDLMAGVYQVAVQLIDMNGTPSNVFPASEPINIGSENNIPGERSQEYIAIQLDGLDCKFHMVRIIIIKTIGGMTSASIIAETHFTNNSMTYEYYGTTGREVPIPLSDVMVKFNTHLRGKDIFLYDNKAWYYNLKPDRNADLQRKVFEHTKVRYETFEVTYEDVMKYGYTSLMRSERYQLAIIYHLEDQRDTPAFILLPTQAATSTGGLPPPPLEVQSKPDRVEYMYKAAALLRYRGRAGAVGSSVVGVVDGEPVCRGGSCGDEIGLRETGNGGREIEKEITEAVNTYLDIIKSSIEAIDTTVKTICDVLDCPPLGECCGVGEGEEGCCISNCDECECDYRHKGANVCYSDWADLEKIHISTLEWLTGMSQNNPNPEYDAESIKEASLELIEKGLENAEIKVYVAPQYTTNMDNAEFTDDVAPSSKTERGDPSSTILGKALVPPHATAWRNGFFKKFESAELYPMTLNCEGEYVYGDYAGKPVQLFEVPGANEIPLYKTFNSGVVNPEDSGNTEWSKTYINLIGLDVYNIYIPTEEELGGKLCKNQPFSIAYVEMTAVNRRVVAKGITHGMFYGKVNGRTYVYPNHAANSREAVDRFISNNDQRRKGWRTRAGENEKGQDGQRASRFTFHSLDTNVYQVGLGVSHIKEESKYKGLGYRYGLYAEGPAPDHPFFGKKVDMRGCRSAHSLTDNTEKPASLGSMYPVDGIGYADANRIVTPPLGVDFPLMNRFRESSVYFQVPDASLPDYTDYSFVGDVLEHSRPLYEGVTNYVALIRENSNPFGSLVGQKYIATGLRAHKGSIIDGKGVLYGICGDTYIGFNAVKRTSYISDKVGDAEFRTGALDQPDTEIDESRLKSVCDPSDSLEIVTVGYNYPTKLPQSGDKNDPKNYAGFYPHDIESPANYDEAVAILANYTDREHPGNDYYYPRTLTHMNYFFGESRVCPWLLQTGYGPQVLLKDVYYPKLKDVGFDPVLAAGKDWEECFMTELHVRVEQPSKAQLWKKFLLKGLINYMLPALDLSFAAMLDNPVNVATYTGIQPALVAGWLFLKDQLLTDEKINELVGIPTCKTDAEGGEGDGNVLGLKDNYLEYNTDYSAPNRVSLYWGMPDPYYTCDCDDFFLGETSTELKYSLTKVMGSYLDNYLSVPPLNSVLVPSKFGKIQKLFVESNRFHVHTDKYLLTLREGRTAVPTASGLSLEIGGSRLLDIPEGPYQTIVEGYLGIQDPNSGISTPFGYVFIDSRARSIYIYRGGSPDKISGYGMDRYFWESLPFNCTNCRDQWTKDGSDYMFGLSYEKKMLYFTKKDCECSYTIGFDLTAKRWHSFYSFVPDFYVWNRDSMFSVKDDKLWLHGAGKYQTFYDKYYPYEVEFAAKLGPILSPVEYKSSIIDSTAYRGMHRDVVQCFNKAVVYTPTQSSNIVDLKILPDRENLMEVINEANYTRLSRDGRVFKFNDVPNKASYGELITVPECYLDNIQVTGGAGEYETTLYDDFIVTRLILDNEEDIQLLTKSVATVVSPRQDS